MKKIKILEIIGDSTLTGGPRHLLSLVKGLDKKRFDITCVCPPGVLAGELKEIEGIKVEIIPMHSKWDFKAIKKLRKIIKFLNPLIVHAHGVRGGWLGRLACIGPKKTAPKVIYTEHLWTSDYRLKNPISHFFQIFGLWFLDLITSKTIAVSKAVADFLVKRGITRPEKLVVIYNGIELPKLSKLTKSTKLTKTIGFVGSLEKRKGIEWLIRAVPELKLKIQNEKLKIIIVGEGKEKENLKKLTKKLKIENQVEFKGFVEKISDIYPTLDVYAQPSLDEAFGISALEAMSFGVPVVASNVGGLRELLNLKSDKCGILVPPKNESALAEVILKILKNEKLAKKMGKAAKKRASFFTASKMVKETEKLYEGLLKS